MSGGHWNYRDATITDEINPEWIPKMLEALRKCFHEVDYAICGDSNKETAGKRCYEILEELGEDLFK